MIYIYLIQRKKYFVDSNGYQPNETVDLIFSESNKLKNIIKQCLNSSVELSISEIVEAYYQVINIKSLVKFVRINLEGKKNIEAIKSLLIRIQEEENYIEENFDGKLHPLVVANIKKLIEISMKELKNLSSKQNGKTKENLEIQAKMYKKLRQIMSTKEFVEQYDKELNNTLKD